MGRGEARDALSWSTQGRRKYMGAVGCLLNGIERYQTYVVSGR